MQTTPNRRSTKSEYRNEGSLVIESYKSRFSERGKKERVYEDYEIKAVMKIQGYARMLAQRKKFLLRYTETVSIFCLVSVFIDKD